MKKTYRIKKHVANFRSSTNGMLPHTYYSIEVLQFKLWFFESWKCIMDFKPITADCTFNSVEEAKYVLKKYDAYQTQLSQNNSVVEQIEL
jgi:hypothetical protein